MNDMRNNLLLNATAKAPEFLKNIPQLGSQEEPPSEIVISEE